MTTIDHTHLALEHSVILIHVYRTDLIDIYDYDIGYIKGVDIKRNNAGFLPDWKLDKVSSS